MNIIERFKVEVYNVGLVTKGIDAVMNEGINKGDIIWLKHKYKDRYFADPFLLDSDDEFYYIICEEFMFFELKGKITVLTVDKKTFELKERKVVIEEPTHLSFPYCKYGEYVIIPESSKSHKCIQYTLDKKNLAVTDRKEIADVGLIDQAIVEDVEGSWMYAGELKNSSSDLYVFKKNHGDDAYKTVSDIPVLSDGKYARGAGDFFTWKGKLYRPVQDCEGRYGKQTRIMEMLKVGKDGYEAKEHIALNSFQNPPYDLTMHTFNVYDECIIVDGSNDFMKFPAKILYRYCRFLFKNRLR